MIISRDDDDVEQNKDTKSESISSTTSDNSNISDTDNNNSDHNSDGDCSDEFMSSSGSYSPFPCDPYESYDWEC